MRSVCAVIGRECSIRLRRPSFWIITLLVPIVLGVLYALPVWTASRQAERATVLVVDQTGLFAEGLSSTRAVAFKSMPSLDYAKREVGEGEVILFVPLRETTIPHDAFLLYDAEEPTAELRTAIDAQLQTLLHNAILEDVYHLEPTVYHSVEHTTISLHTQEMATGRQSHAAVKEVLALVLAVLMALALVVFGVQLFRAVQEERQNRVAEVVATSLRPVALLLGKVIAVAMVAVVQLMLWVALTSVAIAGIQATHADLFAAARDSQELHSVATKGEAATVQYGATMQLVDQTVQGLAAIRLPIVALTFLGYFLLGYLLYGSLIALIASWIGGEADAVGWTLVAVSPLVATLVLAPMLFQGKAAGIQAVLMATPFTAPVAAMLRLPFGISSVQVVVSVVFLLLMASIMAVWAARVYRRRLTL